MPRLALLLALAGSTFALSTLALPAHGQTDPSQPAQPASAPAKPAANQESMPITGITLYRSGVGSFLRSGLVEGDSRVSLQFDISQLNDVLKSLQVLDLDKGRIESVTYSSKEPLARRLASFSVNLADNPSLAQLFERLRGTPVRITTFADGAVIGTVLSVETRRLASGVRGAGSDPSAVIDTPVVNIITPTGVRGVAIPTISTFIVEDPKLADEMNRALMAIAESRAERVKSVDLALSGEGRRRVAATYVHETPVWKTSYRLILPDPKPDGSPDPADIGPILKGWALVENTTDSDWTNVRLSLVSGRPVSFSMDLSEPMYVFRPEVPVPTVAGVMPRQYEGGIRPTSTDSITAGGGRMDAAGTQAMMNAAVAPESARAAPGGRFGARVGNAREFRLAGPSTGSGAPEPMSPAATLTTAEMTDYGMVNRAKGMEVGEQFQYQVQSPVTIERQRSAMIPIIDSNIQGRRVSIYNMVDRADHPLRGVEITNSSGLQLLPGPIAVYDGAAYAGDAQIGQISIGDKRLLAYALDTDIAVQTEPTTDTETVRVRIRGGLIEHTIRSINGTTYTFASKDQQRGRNLLIEHPRLPGWELSTSDETPKATESTQAVHRFALTLTPGQTTTLTVNQVRTDLQQISISTWSDVQVTALFAKGRMSQAVRDAITEAARKQQVVSRLAEQRDDLRTRIEQAKKDQSELTQMLQRLDKQNANYATVSDRLSESFKSLSTLEKQRADADDAWTKARQEYDAYVATLDLE
ncbi:MAG: hypothetical protein MUE97_04790 [Phycisphaerales bacterium]|jgi:hypothetical protein|nr:hypothetical protein [Phycisphaerales bacterium]